MFETEIVTEMAHYPIPLMVKQFISIIYIQYFLRDNSGNVPLRMNSIMRVLRFHESSLSAFSDFSWMVVSANVWRMDQYFIPS